jgi:hypothetical protein
LRQNDVNRFIRLVNIKHKKKIGILIGVGIGLVACLFTPMMLGLIYSRMMLWIANVLDGKFELPLTMITLILLMASASFMMFGLRALIAYVFRRKQYRKK